VPLQTVCQKFFSASLPDVHSFRSNVLVSMAVALTHGADLTLTSLGRTLHPIISAKKSGEIIGQAAQEQSIKRRFRK
ncbi:IS4 family transposase, partial [Enterobacter cloacae subsp. cloacae]|nr:IS4 family transposase [Enterobacter cloacae subsp. cloacae]